MTSNDVFLGGGTSSGSLIRANLPEIYAAINIEDNATPVEGQPWGRTDINMYTYEGAFSKENERSTNFWSIYQTQSGTKADIKFRASRYNSIYNNSNRVNPNYYVIEFWIKFK